MDPKLRKPPAFVNKLVSALVLAAEIESSVAFEFLPHEIQTSNNPFTFQSSNRGRKVPGDSRVMGFLVVLSIYMVFHSYAGFSAEAPNNYQNAWIAQAAAPQMPSTREKDGEQREGVRTTKHARGTRKRGRRRKGKGQCRRTEPEALKFKSHSRP